MTSKKPVAQTQELLREVDILALQKLKVSAELTSYTTVVTSPTDEPVIVTDMAPYIKFQSLANEISLKYPYSTIPTDIRAQQKAGGKPGGAASSSTAYATANTQLIFPPYVDFQSNLKTLSLVPGENPPPSISTKLVKEANFVRTFTINTFTKLYSELLMYDPTESSLSVPKNLSYALASFRTYTLVPFLLSHFKHYSVSVYFQGKDPARDLLVASPLDVLIPGTKDKLQALFTSLKVAENPVYLPLVNYTLTSSQPASTDAQPTEDADAYYYHPHITEVVASGTQYKCTANWANLLAMGMDCLPMDPYDFLLRPFSQLMRIHIPFDTGFNVEALQLLLQCTNRTMSPNMVTFVEFPTLFGFIRDRIRKHFLLSENRGTVAGALARNSLFHKLIDDTCLTNADAAANESKCSLKSASTDHADGLLDEQSGCYSLHLNGDSFQEGQKGNGERSTKDNSMMGIHVSNADESTFLLDLFESVIAEEGRLQVPLSLGVMDVMLMEKTDYNTADMYTRPNSKLSMALETSSKGTHERSKTFSRQSRDTHGGIHSLRSLLEHANVTTNDLTSSTDSSPFDALEEYNPDLIFVKLWTSDPVLAVILSDTFTEHEEDFMQMYATERQLKLYRMIEKKYPNKYNNGRYNKGAVEGASASGPIIIGAVTDSTAMLGTARANYIGDEAHNISLRNSAAGSHTGIPISLQNNTTMVSHAKHGPNMSIYTGRTSRSKMTAKEAAERRRFLKLEKMRARVYELNQGYLPGRKVMLYKDYDPANFPAQQPPAPWNETIKKESTIDVLAADLATIRAMDPIELTVALDTQKRMMKTVSLLPRLRELPNQSQKGKPPAERTAYENTNRNVNGEQPAPGADTAANPASTSRKNPLSSTFDAPEVQIGPYTEEEQPKKTKHHRKQKTIRGYKVIDETAVYTKKTHTYDTVVCDVGADDSLFSDDDDDKVVPMNCCVIRLSTLLELCSGATIIHLETPPKPVCEETPYVINYPLLNNDSKAAQKRSPSTSANVTAQAANQQSNTQNINIKKGPEEPVQKSNPFEGATIENPVWRPKLVSCVTDPLAAGSAATEKIQQKPPSATGPNAAAAKKPQQSAKQAAAPQEKTQELLPEEQIDGFASVTLTKTQALDATATYIGEKDNAFLPSLKKVQTTSMLPTIQFYQLTATLVKKSHAAEEATMQQTDGTASSYALADPAFRVMNLDLDETQTEQLGGAKHRGSDNLILHMGDPVTNAKDLDALVPRGGSTLSHWSFDNWIASESLLVTFTPSYLPTVVQDANIVSQRERSAIHYFELVFYFVREGNLFQKRCRAFSALTIDIIREYYAHTHISAESLQSGMYTMSVLFSIGIYTIRAPHPQTLLNCLAKVAEEQPQEAPKEAARSRSAGSQRKGSEPGTSGQTQEVSEYWEINPTDENYAILNQMPEVDIIEARFHMDLLPYTQHCHGATMNVSAIQRYTGEVGISNILIKPYEQSLQAQEQPDTQNEQQATGSDLPHLHSQTAATQGVLSRMLGTVAIFELVNPDMRENMETPIATAPPTAQSPTLVPVIASDGTLTTSQNVPNSTDNILPVGDECVPDCVIDNVNELSPDHTAGEVFLKASETTFVRLCPCFDEGVPAGSTIYLYVIDENSEVLHARVPLCINGTLVQTSADLIVSATKQTFVFFEGFSTYTPVVDPKSKIQQPVGLMPFRLTLTMLSDTALTMKLHQLSSNLFQLRTPLKLDSNDKSSIELKCTMPGGHCYLELGLVSIPVPQEKQNEEKELETEKTEQPTQPEGEMTAEENKEEAVINLEQVSTQEPEVEQEPIILPVNIFQKPLLPVFEAAPLAAKAKTSPQKKPAEEETPVKVTDDIKVVLQDDAVQMSECTKNLVPVLCSGCLLDSKRVFLIKVPASGVIALNAFVPAEIAQKHSADIYIHLRTYSFHEQSEIAASQVEQKGKPAEPSANNITLSQANLNDWILQKLCTTIWSKNRVLQGEELLSCATYLASNSKQPSITTQTTYSFVPNDELIAYIETRADTEQSKAATDKKAKAPPAKKKETEPSNRTADPLELTLEGVQCQEKDDLSTVIAAEAQAIQTYTVCIKEAQEIDRKQAQAKKLEVKKDKNVVDSSSLIIGAFQKKLSAQWSQAEIGYFDVEIVTGDGKKREKDLCAPTDLAN